VNAISKILFLGPLVGIWILQISVLDTELAITDPDPQGELRNFLSGSSSESRSLHELQMLKTSLLIFFMTQMGFEIQVYRYLKYFVCENEEFYHFLIHFQKKLSYYG